MQQDMANLVAPEMPEFYSPANSFLKGFTAVAAVNQARLKSELSMQRMAQDMTLKQQAMEQQLAFKDREYDLREKAAASQANNAASRIDIAERGLGLKEEKQNFEKDKFEMEIIDTQGVLRDINRIQHKPGTPEYNASLAEIAAKHPYATKNSLAKSVITKSWSDHEDAVKSKTKLFHDKLDRLKLPYNAFLNADVAWKESPDVKGKIFYATPRTTKQGVLITDNSGNQVIDYVTLDKPVFKKLDEEFRSIVNASNVSPSRQMDKDDDKQSLAITRAKTAIAKGAPRAQVEERLRSMSIDPARLDE